jgi:hypothetical protein
MKATVMSTSQIVTVNGIPARVWKGVTESGVPFEMIVVRVAVSNVADTSQFEADLREMAPPLVESAYAARLMMHAPRPGEQTLPAVTF